MRRDDVSGLPWAGATAKQPLTLVLLVETVGSCLIAAGHAVEDVGSLAVRNARCKPAAPLRLEGKTSLVVMIAETGRLVENLSCWIGSQCERFH